MLWRKMCRSQPPERKKFMPAEHGRSPARCEHRRSILLGRHRGLVLAAHSIKDPKRYTVPESVPANPFLSICPMNSRILSFLLATVILIVVRFAMLAARRRGRSFLETNDTTVLGWSPKQLLLASFLTLFAELAFIRWIAVEVRIFAYFKNLALLLCFVGFGLGCALAKQKPRWSSAVAAFLGLLLVIRIPWRGRIPLEQLSQSLGGGGDVAIWAVGPSWTWTNFLTGAV